jgi:hypothetical protein
MGLGRTLPLDELATNYLELKVSIFFLEERMGLGRIELKVSFFFLEERMGLDRSSLGMT